MNERMRFVVRAGGDETMAKLCREFGISRELGYRLVRRYKEEGVDGLRDRSRAPKRQGRRTSPEIEELVLKAQKEHGWGARKLRKVLMRDNPELRLPCISTFHEILKRHGLTKPRRKRRAVPMDTSVLRAPTAPNQLWCADFKGQFRLKNGKYCYPLTITDAYSRYILACEAHESTKAIPARAVFQRVFREHGLPLAILTDNGSPFASRALCGLSKLSVSWLRLGIKHQRIDPGHPEQNGRHERMHRTLKAATTRPAGDNILQQQDRFDAFCSKFNKVRPHEALDDETPASFYRNSSRRLAPVQDLAYPLHDLTCRVAPSGNIRLPKCVAGQHPKVYVSQALEDECVGLREQDDGRWLVSFANTQLGTLDLESRAISPIHSKTNH